MRVQIRQIRIMIICFRYLFQARLKLYNDLLQIYISKL